MGLGKAWRVEGKAAAQRVSEPLLQEQEQEQEETGGSAPRLRSWAGGSPLQDTCVGLVSGSAPLPCPGGPAGLPRKLSSLHRRVRSGGNSPLAVPRCPPLPQAISLPWLPALLNTRPGFPSSVKASGFPSPPGASCSPGPRPGSRSHPSS